MSGSINSLCRFWTESLSQALTGSSNTTSFHHTAEVTYNGLSGGYQHYGAARSIHGYIDVHPNTSSQTNNTWNYCTFNGEWHGWGQDSRREGFKGYVQTATDINYMRLMNYYNDSGTDSNLYFTYKWCVME